MADPKPAPAMGLGDFFAKKGKNKKAGIKGTNLNTDASANKTEEKKKAGPKDKEEEGWEEELVVAPTMKVETVGKLTRDEDKKEEEEVAAPAWGTAKVKASDVQINDKKFPTLAKSVQSSNINLDDEPKLNIKTTKNAFAALEDPGDDDEGPKRPKEIKPAMVTKQKGEREKDVIRRELEKYKKEDKKSKKKKEDDDDDDEDEDDEEEEEAPVPEKKKEVKKKVAKKEVAAPEEEEEAEDDEPKIQPDLVASKKKYEGRRKLPKVDLPRSELEEEKENKPAPQQAASKKKKKGRFFDEEEDAKPKLLQYVDDDF